MQEQTGWQDNNDLHSSASNEFVHLETKVGKSTERKKDVDKMKMRSLKTETWSLEHFISIQKNVNAMYNKEKLKKGNR